MPCVVGAVMGGGFVVGGSVSAYLAAQFLPGARGHRHLAANSRPLRVLHSAG